MSYEELVKRKSRLQEELEADQDVLLLKDRAQDLQNFLNQVASELAPHDLQKFSNDTDDLLKRVNAKASAPVKKFQFKSKPKFKKKPAAVPVIAPVKSNTVPTTDHCIFLQEPTAVYENLQRCVIVSNHLMARRGSLTLTSLFSCIVNLHEAPFDEGSIRMAGCQACSINLHTGRDTQIRLHNLQDCKILVKPLQGRQTVIMENCQNCVFHKVCEPWVTIQDFDNLGLTENKLMSYKFQVFEEPWQEA